MCRSYKFSRSGRLGFILKDCIGIIILLTLLSGLSSGSPVEIIHSGSDKLEFNVHVESVSFTKHVFRNGDLVLFEPHIKEFQNIGEPWQVNLPAWSTWIVVPPGTQPVSGRATAMRRSRSADAPRRAASLWS